MLSFRGLTLLQVTHRQVAAQSAAQAAILLTATLIGATACQRNTTAEDYSLQATFQIKETRGTPAAQDFLAKTSLPRNRTIAFESCLYDIYKRNVIVDRFFVVSGGEKTLQLKTDTKGCLNWTETFAYDFISDAKNVKIERKLKAIDVHRGERTITLAVNPWSGLVLDMAIVKDPPNLILESELPNYAMKRRLLVTRLFTAVAVNQRLDAEGAQGYNFQLTLNTAVHQTDINGAQEFKAVTGGEYEIQGTLMHVMIQGETQFLDHIDTSAPIRATTSNNDIVTQIKFKGARIYDQGTLLLGLKVRLLSGPKNLEPYQNLYVLGPNEQMESTKLPQPYFEAAKELETFEIDQFVRNKEGLSLMAARLGNRSLTRKPGYLFTKIMFVPDILTRNIEDSLSTRKRRARFQACVEDSLNHDKIINQDFEVIPMYGKVSTKLLPTSTLGCFYWEEEYEFERYGPICFEQKEIRFLSKNSGVSQIKKVSFNPWSKEIIDNDQAGGPVNSCALNKDDIFITGETAYPSQTTISHRITPNLSLQMSRDVWTRIPCKVRHPTPYDSLHAEPCVIGNYQIRYAYIRGGVEVLNSIDSADVVSIGTTTAAISNSDSTLLANLKINNAESDMHLVYYTLAFEILPLSDSKRPLPYVKPKAQFGPIYLGGEKPNASMFTTDFACGSRFLEQDKNLPCNTPMLMDQIFSRRQKQEMMSLAAFKFRASPKFLAEREQMILINYGLSPEQQETPAARQLWAKILSSLQREFSDSGLTFNKGHLDFWIRKRIAHPLIGKAFCASFFDGLSKSDRLSHFCNEDLMNFKNPNTVFLNTYRYFIRNAQSEEEAVGAPTIFSISRGLGYSLGNDYSRQESRGVDYGFSTSGNLPLPRGLFFLHWNLLQVSGGYKRSWSATNSEREGVGSDMKIQPLNQWFQQLEIPVRYDSAEHCVAVQVRSSLLTRRPLIFPKNDSGVGETLYRRVLFCPGNQQKQLHALTEKFYFVWEDTPMQSFLVDARNTKSRHNISFRGHTDLLRLLALAEGKVYQPVVQSSTELTNYLTSEELANAMLFAPAVFPGELSLLGH